MSTKHLLDPELLPITEFPLHFDLSADALPTFREQQAAVTQLTEPEESVIRSEIQINSADGSSISCLLYEPARSEGLMGGYLHIHGGGYIMGSAVGSDVMNLMVCAQLGVVVLSVEYRLAPEATADAALADCYAGLAWFHNNHESVNVDPSRIAVGGESAGGGLAAALAIEARDSGEYTVCHQHLTYPMLDDRTGSEAEPGDPLTGEYIWTRERNQFGWDCYLGDLDRAAPYVPARVTSAEGLPPAWIHTVTLDLFRDENIAYAQRLMMAGVSTELHVEPGACHGFQLVPGTSIGQRYIDAHLSALGRALS